VQAAPLHFQHYRTKWRHNAYVPRCEFLHFDWNLAVGRCCIPASICVRAAASKSRKAKRTTISPLPDTSSGFPRNVLKNTVKTNSARIVKQLMEGCPLQLKLIHMLISRGSQITTRSTTQINCTPMIVHIRHSRQLHISHCADAYRM
jgi:hypothetical protein